jgi:hypothetical protein
MSLFDRIVEMKILQNPSRGLCTAKIVGFDEETARNSKQFQFCNDKAMGDSSAFDDTGEPLPDSGGC